MSYILDLITDDLKKRNCIGLKNEFFGCNCKIGNLINCNTGIYLSCEPTYIYVDKNYKPVLQEKEGGKNNVIATNIQRRIK